MVFKWHVHEWMDSKDILIDIRMCMYIYIYIKTLLHIHNCLHTGTHTHHDIATGNVNVEKNIVSSMVTCQSSANQDAPSSMVGASLATPHTSLQPWIRCLSTNTTMQVWCICLAKSGETTKGIILYLLVELISWTVSIWYPLCMYVYIYIYVTIYIYIHDYTCM